MATTAQNAHLAELKDRLIDDYGTERRATVHTMLEQERARFSSARIPAFVPILVERSVRSRLDR